MVKPTVEYACTVWDLLNQKKIKFIEQVQKSSERFVDNNYTDRTPGCVTNMVKSLKWENLEDQRKTARLSMLFKIQHELIDIDRQQYLTPSDSRTRGKNRFYQERSPTIILPFLTASNFKIAVFVQLESK